MNNALNCLPFLKNTLSEAYMNISKITNITEKQNITRYILEALPDWFGIPEAREEYIEGSKDNIFFCAYEQDKPVGFLYIKETGKATTELAVMGVLKEYHRHVYSKFYTTTFNCLQKTGLSH